MTEKHNLPWKLITAALVTVVAVAVVIALEPWKRNPNEDTTLSNEYVWVQYLASFELLGTSDNGPIENSAVSWSYPYFTPSEWEIASTLEERASVLTETPSRENIRVIFLPGESQENRGDLLFAPYYENWFDRELPLGIIDSSIENSKYTVPTIYLSLVKGKIYPGDEIQLEAWFKVLTENLPKISLVNYFVENRAVASVTWNINWTYFDGYTSPSYAYSGERQTGFSVSEKMINASENETLQEWSREISEASNHSLVKLYSNID